MNENIVAANEQSELEAEFEVACNDPQGLDCGFEEQRCGSDFANFGYPPDKALELREKELARIAAEMEDEDDSDYDRFKESYGFDEDEEEDNWE